MFQVLPILKKRYLKSYKNDKWTRTPIPSPRSARHRPPELLSRRKAGPLVRVYGAIIFYLGTREKVEAYLRDQERLWDKVKAETVSPEALSARLTSPNSSDV